MKWTISIECEFMLEPVGIKNVVELPPQVGEGILIRPLPKKKCVPV